MKSVTIDLPHVGASALFNGILILLGLGDYDSGHQVVPVCYCMLRINLGPIFIMWKPRWARVYDVFPWGIWGDTMVNRYTKLRAASLLRESLDIQTSLGTGLNPHVP